MSSNLVSVWDDIPVQANAVAYILGIVVKGSIVLPLIPLDAAVGKVRLYMHPL